jgi:type IV pilus assembly protein PilW
MTSFVSIKPKLYSKPNNLFLYRSIGFSLVELMVAIAIGLVIMLTLITLFININRSNEEMTKINSQIENGRFAMQLLEDDLVHAGFWDTYVPQFDDLTYTGVPTDAPLNVPNPCTAYPWSNAHQTDLLGVPINVYGNTPPSGPGCGSLVSNKQDNTDVLVVRHAETCIPGEVNCEGDVAGMLYFQASMTHNAFCQAPLTPDTVPYTLTTSGFDTLRKRDCVTPVTAKRKFISNIYYVRDYAVNVGDGIPTLMLAQFGLVGGTLGHIEGIPLIEGIEGFKVEIGVDSLSDTGSIVDYSTGIIWSDNTNLISPSNRGDGSPDGSYVSCTDDVPCTVDQLTNTVAVKLHVLARADRVSQGYVDTKIYRLGNTILGPYNDNYKRHVFSTTVRLNNISARRETP